MVDGEPAVHLLGADRPVTMSRKVLAAIALVLAVASLTGCSHGSSAPSRPSGAPTGNPPAAPANHACYDLDIAAALQLSSTAKAVPCRGRHTAVTVYVGRIPLTIGGHVRAMGSTRVQSIVGRTCRRKVDAHVGGSTEVQRLSRVQAVWFSPTASGSALGARWFRCDLVIAADAHQFAALPQHTRGLLARSGALARFGTCGTAAPSAAGFHRLTCSAAHTWRAVATIDLPAHVRYLAKRPGATASSACRDIEARLAKNVFRLRWSFEWPTPAQWKAGQRYGFCWIPGT
ncbi:MAG: hypothetical protein JWP74_1583 [Marmoricola sp.]|nr:hypothetical protein [Marmoricola sp.]